MNVFSFLRLMLSFAAGVILLATTAPIAAQARTSVNLWPGGAPGSEHWNWHEKVYRDVVYQGKQLGTIIQDVVTPTLTLYLPKAAQATGTGIIIAPGGACVSLSMKAPREVAKFLQDRGIAAFVLKYRVPRKTYSGPPPTNLNEDLACKWAIADAIQALKVVRKHAAQRGVSAKRIGMMGFSAGGMLSSATLTLKDASLRPNFVGLIYGAPFASMPAIPAKLPPHYKLASPALPPVFMAWAQNDNTAGYAMRRFYRLLVAQGYQPEAHIYHAGGHGFAPYTLGGSSDHWKQEFYWWLQAQGFTGKADK